MRRCAHRFLRVTIRFQTTDDGTRDGPVRWRVTEHLCPHCYASWEYRERLPSLLESLKETIDDPAR